MDTVVKPRYDMTPNAFFDPRNDVMQG
ncbi:MAG: hypothetical protein AB8U53_05270 [Rickettsia aeschlimannii]